jgi:hypothetical protein
VARRLGNTLEKWEVAIVKAMLAKKYVPQDIQAYFSRPTRSINHARVSEIRDGTKHKGVKVASDAELDGFLAAWPDIDPNTGLHLQGDELLIKARDAMIAAVHTFNSAGLYGLISYTHTTSGRALTIDTREAAPSKRRQPGQRNTGN